MIAMSGMIEKLPHYGKYSYLSFLGDEPTNDIKGTWASNASPLRWTHPDLQVAIDWENLPEVPPIAELPPKYSPERLLSHAETLADPAMFGRGLGSASLDRAASYITAQFYGLGLEPIRGSYQQIWTERVPGLGDTRLTNVVGMIPGANPEFANQPLVIGAHYDHIGVDSGTGAVYPGADDNASGVSVLLEVASKLANSYTPQRPIIFVAFTGEEEGLFGSRYFVDKPPGDFQTDQLFAMINLDAVGRLEGRNATSLCHRVGL